MRGRAREPHSNESGGNRASGLLRHHGGGQNKEKGTEVKVTIAGGHGKIALRLTRLLVSSGNDVVGLIRSPVHAVDVLAAGGTATICDLEQATLEEIATALEGSDAVVFAAGAGPGSGADRKLTMDRDGAIKLMHAASASGVSRYVMVSATGVENPPSGDDVFEVYLRAKAEADAALEASDLEWTILRPGGLTDEAGTGNVRMESSPFSLLADRRSAGQILYLSSGSTPLDEVLDHVLG
jgi:nucleoside-diphosphate-sugar epimerase